MNRLEDRAIFSSLFVKSIARMPETLQPMGRPSDWRNTWTSKVKYMFLRVMVSGSSMSCFVRWRIRLLLFFSACYLLSIYFCSLLEQLIVN